MPEDIDWHFPSYGEGPSTVLSAVMPEELATLPGNMANAISESFTSVKTSPWRFLMMTKFMRVHVQKNG